jgi:hypothetical protein
MQLKVFRMKDVFFYQDPGEGAQEGSFFRALQKVFPGTE